MLGLILNKKTKAMKHLIKLIDSLCLQKSVKDLYCFLASRFRIKIYKYSEEQNALVLIHASPPWHLSQDEVAPYTGNEMLYKAFFLDKIIKFNESIYVPCATTERFVFSFYNLSDVVGFIETIRLVLTHVISSLSSESNTSIIGKSTGLYRSCFFEEALSHEIIKFLRKGGTSGIVVIYLQNLKKINETYSHEIGDEALAQVSAQVKTLFRASDICAHYKNGRLCVLTIEASDLLARRSKESLGQFKFTSSIGKEIEVLCNVSYIFLQDLVRKGSRKEDSCVLSLSRFNRFLAVLTNMPLKEDVISPQEVFVYGHWE